MYITPQSHATMKNSGNMNTLDLNVFEIIFLLQFFVFECGWRLLNVQILLNVKCNHRDSLQNRHYQTHSNSILKDLLQRKP